jgi:uncharacterized protein YjiS (DUF1127 family)
MTGIALLSPQSLGRIGLYLVALAAGSWGVEAVAARVQTGADIEAVATRILQDKAYTRERLVELRATDDHGHSCAAPRFELAVIQLRLFEQAFSSGDQQAAAVERRALDDSIAALMRCDPNESFFPLVSAALALGDSDEPLFIAELRRSYRNGPFENWVSLRRSPIALAHLDRLPPDLADQAVAEFTNLVNSGLNEDAETVFVGLPAETRGRLMAGLAERARPARHRSFINTLLAEQKKPRKSRGARRVLETFSLPAGTSLGPPAPH